MVVPEVSEIAQPLQKTETGGGRLAGGPKRRRHDSRLVSCGAGARARRLRDEKRERGDDQLIPAGVVPFPERVERPRGIDHRGPLTRRRRPQNLGEPPVGVRVPRTRGRQKHQRELVLLVGPAADLFEPEQVAVKMQGCIEIAHAQHGVQKSHGGLLLVHSISPEHT